jgi:hypothetical protein
VNANLRIGYCCVDSAGRRGLVRMGEFQCKVIEVARWRTAIRILIQIWYTIVSNGSKRNEFDSLFASEWQAVNGVAATRLAKLADQGTIRDGALECLDSRVVTRDGACKTRELTLRTARFPKTRNS